MGVSPAARERRRTVTAAGGAGSGVRRAGLRLRGRPRDAYWEFAFGAQISASADLLRARGLAFWQDLYELSRQPELRLADFGTDNYGIGLLMEFTWPHLCNYLNQPTLPAEPIREPWAGELTTADHFARIWPRQGQTGVIVHPVAAMEW